MVPTVRRGPLLLLLIVTLSACSSSGSAGSTNRSSGRPPEQSTPPSSRELEPPTSPTVVDATLATPDGRVRSYRLVVPSGSGRAGPRPLLVALHGGVGSGLQFERNSGYTDLAIRHDFIVVYPDGIEIGGTGALARGHVWNGGKCCGRAYRDDVDDVGFLTALIGKITDDEAVDARRIYATGHSNGAIMSYRLACERADTIAAIGVQAGSIEIDDCAPSAPVSLLAVHGTADTNIPIDGGRGTGLSTTAFSSPTAAVETFARSNRCRRSTRRPAADNPDVQIERWRGCADRTGVEFVRVAGANHAWMGHPTGRAGRGLVGEPYRRFDSSTAIWQFLAAHPRADDPSR